MEERAPPAASLISGQVAAPLIQKRVERPPSEDVKDGLQSVYELLAMVNYSLANVMSD